MNKKTLVLSLAAAGALFAAGAAEARVGWSIGIDVPGVSTVVSNAPVYRQVPVYVSPPVVYAPAPRYFAPPAIYAPVPRYVAPPEVRYDDEPAPIAYYPPVQVYRPAPVVVYPDYRYGDRAGWHHGWDHGGHHGWDRHDDGRRGDGRH